MSEHKDFEKQLKDKLEAYEPAYLPDDWKAFQHTYGRPGRSKLWYLPYLWSLLLFGTALAIFFYHPAIKQSSSGSPSENLQPANQMLIRDTVYLVKRDTVYISEVKLSAYPFGKTTLQQTSSSTQKEATANTTSTNVPLSNSNTFLPASSLDDSAVARKVTPLVLQDLPIPPVNTTIALETDTSDQSVLLEPENADIETEKTNKNRKTNLLAGPVSQVFLPTGSKNLDKYPAVFGGLAIGLSRGRFQLSTGIQYGTLIHEFDDIDRIPQSQIERFPGYSMLPEEPENIEVKTTHWLLPVSLSFTALRKDKITLKTSTGVLFNYLTREQLYYIFDDEESDQTIVPLAIANHWKASHLIMGTELTYSINPTLGISLEPLYQLPLSNLGNTALSYSSLSIQLKLALMLGSRAK